MSTLAELHEQRHTLALYCAACDRWSTADLARLIDGGYGDRSLTGSRFRCRDCGGTAEKQLRPPVPEVRRAAAYI